MRKEYLPFDTIRNNAIKLCYEIARSFGIPDVIYVSLRGGAAMGNIISEYFKLLARDKKVFYAAVVARAYHDIGVSSQVQVDGWTWLPENIKSGDRVLFVDDIFDTGRTINHCVRLIMDCGVPRSDIAVAVHDYKLRSYETQAVFIHPDFYCRKHVVAKPEEDFWIHYLVYELKSLSDEELERYYICADPELKKAIDLLKKD